MRYRTQEHLGAQGERTLSLDPLGRFLKDVASIPLLTPEEEINLVYKLKSCRGSPGQLRAPDGKPELPQRGEFAECLRAREQLIMANFRLVVSVARRYVGLGASLEDLVQEGIVGLMQAIDRFEPALGFKLSTYATWWIRHTILKHIEDNSRPVRIPQHLIAKFQHLQHAVADVEQQLQRSPTFHELAEFLEIPRQKLSRLICNLQPPVSLDSPSAYTDSMTLYESIADLQAEDPSLSLSETALSEDLDRVLRKLPERERRVLTLRYGLPPASGTHTLDEIGRLLGITGERARQLEKQALRRLRQMAGPSLRPYLMAD